MAESFTFVRVIWCVLSPLAVGGYFGTTWPSDNRSIIKNGDIKTLLFGHFKRKVAFKR